MIDQNPFIKFNLINGRIRNKINSVDYSASNYNYNFNPIQNKISKYIIGNEIGKGAYATVKSVILKESKQKYAMKIYDKFKLFDKSKKEAVLREIQVMKKIDHKNIVKIIEVIHTEKQVYIILYNIDPYYNGICKRNIFKTIL